MFVEMSELKAQSFCQLIHQNSCCLYWSLQKGQDLKTMDFFFLVWYENIGRFEP